MSNIKWRVIGKEEIKKVPVGSPIRVDGVETTLERHYAGEDYGFDVEDFVLPDDSDIFSSKDWNNGWVVEAPASLFSGPEENSEKASEKPVSLTIMPELPEGDFIILGHSKEAQEWLFSKRLKWSAGQTTPLYLGADDIVGYCIKSEEGRFSYLTEGWKERGNISLDTPQYELETITIKGLCLVEQGEEEEQFFGYHAKNIYEREGILQEIKMKIPQVEVSVLQDGASLLTFEKGKIVVRNNSYPLSQEEVVDDPKTFIEKVVEYYKK